MFAYIYVDVLLILTFVGHCQAPWNVDKQLFTYFLCLCTTLPGACMTFVFLHE